MSKSVPTNPFVDYQNVKIKDTLQFYKKHSPSRGMGFFHRLKVYLSYRQNHMNGSFLRPITFFFIGYFLCSYSVHVPHFRMQADGISKENYKSWFGPLYKKFRDPDWPEEIKF